MFLLILSFIAGVLTIAAPCIFTLLPVIVGGSIVRTDTDKNRQFIRPLIITASLVGSIILFTLLLRASTLLLDIPTFVWQLISGSIVTLLGLSYLFTDFWPKLMVKIGLEHRANAFLGKSAFKKGYGGDIATGAALGPVFSSCSPTYAFVVAAILPISFLEGLAYLLAYAIGLALTLLVITFAGQSLAIKLGWLANPNGKFRRVIAIIFIMVGLAIIFGLDKKLEASLLESGLIDGLINIENNLRQN